MQSQQLQSSSSSPQPRTSSPEQQQQQQPESQKPSIAFLTNYLRTSLPSLFNPSVEPDFTYYANRINFIDPLNKFTSVSAYKKNIQFLKNSPVFSQTYLHLHHIYTPPTTAENVLKTRWTLGLTMNALPWKPALLFTGISKYVVGEEGMFVEHVDYWDSIENNEYFSWEAVKDIVKQVVPWKVERSLRVDRSVGGEEGLGEWKGVEVMRRKGGYEIWRIREKRMVGDEVECIWVVGVEKDGKLEVVRKLEGEEVTAEGLVAVVGEKDKDRGMDEGRLEKWKGIYDSLCKMLEEDKVQYSNKNSGQTLFKIAQGRNGTTEVWIQVDDYGVDPFV